MKVKFLLLLITSFLGIQNVFAAGDNVLSSLISFTRGYDILKIEQTDEKLIAISSPFNQMEYLFRIEAKNFDTGSVQFKVKAVVLSSGEVKVSYE